MTGVHVGLHERSCYGYDVVVRIGDGRTPPRWDRRLQEERVAYRLGIGVPLRGLVHGDHAVPYGSRTFPHDTSIRRAPPSD